MVPLIRNHTHIVRTHQGCTNKKQATEEGKYSPAPMRTSFNKTTVRTIHKTKETLVKAITPSIWFDWFEVRMRQVSRKNQLRFNQTKGKTQDHNTSNAIKKALSIPLESRKGANTAIVVNTPKVAGVATRLTPVTTFSTPPPFSSISL